MKLSKTKKIILLGTTIGVLTTAIVVPVIFLGDDENNQEKQNQKDVDQVVKILEAKSEEEKIITLPSDTQGKIIAKIKTLISSQNLKAVKIEISMSEDKNILATKQEIIITISKGKYSKKVASAKAYFVKREQNEQEIIADINSVKTALTNLSSSSKALKLFVEKADKSINANKDAILKTLKRVEGYSEIDFKKVKIKVKESNTNLPSINQSPINIIFILSKGSVTPVEIDVFTIKQIDSVEVESIKNELNKIKSSLEGLSSKVVEVDAPSLDKTVTHNKVAIKSAIENLSGYSAISSNFNGATLEIKDSNNNLPSNDQPAVAITLVLWKNSVNLEVQGFSAKQMLFSTTINSEIIAVKTILDGKSGEDLIITLPSNSTGNIIENANNKNTIIKKLRTLIDPSNTNGEANHSSLKGTTIEISIINDRSISTTPQDILVSISKSEGRTLTTRKTFRVKRAFTADEDIAAIKNILDSKIENDLIITLPSSSTGTIIGSRIVSGSTVNKIAIEKELRKLIDPSNTNGNPNHASLRGTSIQISKSPNAPISTTPQDVVVSISKSGGTTLRTTNTFQVKRAFTNVELANEDIKAIFKILNDKTGQDLIIMLPSNSTGFIIQNRTNKIAIIKKIIMLIDPSNTNGEANHASLRGTTIEALITIDETISTTPRYIEVYILKRGGKSILIRDKFQVKKESTSK